MNDLDWNSSMYYVYEDELTTSNILSYDDINSNGVDSSSSSGSNYTDGEKSKVTAAYEHAQTQGNPHNTQIGDINGLRAELDDLKDDIEEAGIYDAANAITGVEGGGAKVIENEEGKKVISLDVNTNSAVDIKDGKITLEWEG